MDKKNTYLSFIFLGIKRKKWKEGGLYYDSTSGREIHFLKLRNTYIHTHTYTYYTNEKKKSLT